MKLVSNQFLAVIDYRSRVLCLYDQSNFEEKQEINLSKSLTDHNLSRDKTKYISFVDKTSMKWFWEKKKILFLFSFKSTFLVFVFSFCAKSFFRLFLQQAIHNKLIIFHKRTFCWINFVLPNESMCSFSFLFLSVCSWNWLIQCSLIAASPFSPNGLWI